MRVGLGGISGTNILSVGLGTVALGGGGGCTPVDQIDGNVPDDATFTHPADGVIAWTQNALPESITLIRFRQVDATNTLQININSVGNLVLQRVLAGGATNLESVGGAVSGSGERIVVVCSGTTIEVWVAGVRRINKAGVTDFAARTNGKAQAVEPGDVSDLKTWTLDCRTMEMEGV